MVKGITGAHVYISCFHIVGSFQDTSPTLLHHCNSLQTSMFCKAGAACTPHPCLSLDFSVIVRD